MHKKKKKKKNMWFGSVSDTPMYYQLNVINSCGLRNDDNCSVCYTCINCDGWIFE